MTAFTKDDPRCADVLARLELKRKEMLKAGIKPLVRAKKHEPQRPAWQRIELMHTAEKPSTVTQLRKRK